MAYSWKKQASAAYGYSMSRLALQAFLYVDGLPESYEGLWEKQADMDRRFMGLLEAWLDKGLSEERLAAFREELVHRMETMTAYLDYFQIYEYVWNRLKRRVVTDLKPTGISDEGMVKALMGYLASGMDAASVNHRIQRIICQLPVRFTRQKYYGMLREALTSYIGADKEGLDNQMYFLRTGALVELDEEQKDSEPQLRELLGVLQSVSMREVTPEQYHDVEAKIRQAGGLLSVIYDYLRQVQEMVNELYVLLLTQDDAVKDAALEGHVVHILKGLCQVYQDREGQAMDEIEAELLFLEGAQEEFFMKYSRLEPVPLQGGVSEIGRGIKVDRLLSSSLYAPLEKKTQETVTADIVDEAVNGFIASLEPVFASCQKPVARAIMATTLSFLPVCFNSLGEVQTYIAGSFDSCSDYAEKETCKEILLEMMEMDGYDALV